MEQTDDRPQEAAPDRSGPVELLRIFFLLGCTSFGGPVAHLGYFREAFVERRGWFTDRAYAHVPLAYGPSGDRLAKRDGAVTLDDLEALGVSAETVTRQILESIFGPEAPRNLSEAASAFSPDDIEWAPWNLTAHQVAAIDRR